MDWQKNLLIAAIIAVLFMLAIRWNQFQESHVAIPQVKTTQVDTDFDTPSESANDIPTVPTVDGTPTLEKVAKANPSVVKVYTDSLEVYIDTHGGDIVHVALPRHYAKLNEPDVPFVLLDKSAQHTYIAQSGLVGKDGTDSAEGRPTFTVDKKQYRLEKDEDQLTVDLKLQQGAVGITKRYIFTRGENLIKIEYLVDNQSDQAWAGNLYGQIKRDSQEFTKSSAIGIKPFLGAAITTMDTNYKKITFKEINDKVEPISRKGGWIAMVQHYFISAWIPGVDSQNKYYLRRVGDQDLYLLGFTGETVEIPAGSQGTLSTRFYAGPKDTARLEEISPHLDLTVDYGLLWWIAKPLFALMKFIHTYVGNWGLSIILLTVCVKAAFFKLSATSYKSMAKMRKLAPKMQELKERCGDDRQKLSQEMMKLYKTEKVNPLGGCLPILVQMPVFLALYWTLMESVELRQAPFILWIQDLSVRDPYFVLPLIMGLTMFLQMKLNPTPPDPMQARVMQLMPIIFTFMFLWFPAGLVLYWVTNNTLGIIQQYVVTRQIEKADAKA